MFMLWSRAKNGIDAGNFEGDSLIIIYVQNLASSSESLAIIGKLPFSISQAEVRNHRSNIDCNNRQRSIQIYNISVHNLIRFRGFFYLHMVKLVSGQKGPCSILGILSV